MAAVALRYARAFAAVAEAQNVDATAARQQLEDFATSLEGSRELHEFLGNPSIAQEQKDRVVDALAGRLGLAPAVRNFVLVIVQHERLHELREIVAAYATLADEETGVAEAQITTARPLDASTKEVLEQQVTALTGGRRVQATYAEDASLLGGAVVKIGSTVYDGSVRAQLQQLKQRMIAAV